MYSSFLFDSVFGKLFVQSNRSLLNNFAGSFSSSVKKFSVEHVTYTLKLNYPLFFSSIYLDQMKANLYARRYLLIFIDLF